MRSHLEHLDQRAHALDADLLDRLGLAVVVGVDEVEHAQVRMRAGGDVRATRATAAREGVVARRLAQEPLREVHREHRLADTRRAGDQ